jgi:hypothetical protein
MTFLRRPFRAVEIVQPLCSRTFGTSPCDATGVECYNTDKTCKFRDALDLSETLSLFFVENRGFDWRDEPGAFQPALAIPALENVQTAPTVLNVASGSRNKSPLGYRAVCQVQIKDFPWNDVGTDPYVSDRGYDPATKGSFWSKWLARNPFHVGYILRVYEGELGQTLAELTRREYIIEKIDAGRNGVTITAKDILRKVTDTGVTAPALSPGELTLDLAIGGTSFQVAGAVLDDYPATGWVRIGSEVIRYTGRATVGGNVEFTGLTRGDLNTEAAAHKQLARVQRVLAYVDEPFHDILYDLFTVWGLIDTSYITKADWDQEYTLWRPQFNFTAYITQPTKVEDLAAEVCLQALANVWWDERLQKIILKAQRPDFAPDTITDDAHILAGSYSIKELPEERASQVFVYYNLRNPTLSVTDRGSYGNAAVFINVLGQVQYGGEPAIRELFCRFITTGAIANNLASTYLSRFSNVRREITFELAQEDIVWTGETVNIEHFLDSDEHGDRRKDNWLVIEAGVEQVGGRYRFVAEDNGSAGVLWLWQDENEVSLTWDDATEEERETIGYWLNEDGTDAGGNPRPFRWL